MLSWAWGFLRNSYQTNGTVSMSQHFWAIPPVRLGLSGRNSRKIPERPWKRSQSVSWNSPQQYGWDAPSPIIQVIWGFQSISRILSLPVPSTNDYQNNSVKIILCNCPGAITGFLCRAPENNSPNIFSCKSPCPVRAPPGLCPGTTEITEKRGSYRMRKIIPQKFYYVIAPGALTGFSCRAPENNSKIIFSCL